MVNKLIIAISGVSGAGKDQMADILGARHNCCKIALADKMKQILFDVIGFSKQQLFGPSKFRNIPDEKLFTYEPFKSIYEEEDYKTFLMLDGKFPNELTEEELNSELAKGKRKYLIPRDGLLKLGQAGKDFYIHFWVDYTLRAISQILNEGYWYDQTCGTWSESISEGGSSNYSGAVIPDLRFISEIERVKEHGAKIVRIKRNNLPPNLVSGNHPSETEQLTLPDSYFDYVIENNGTLEDLYAEVEKMFTALNS